MQFEDVKDIVERHVCPDMPQDNIILLKEPSLYCFFLRHKMPEPEPFMEWSVKTVLLWEVQKLASAIKVKDNQMQASESTNEKNQKFWGLIKRLMTS